MTSDSTPNDEERGTTETGPTTGRARPSRSRRQWLALCCAAALPGLAGCSGGGDATEDGAEGGTDAGGTESTADGDTTAAGGGAAERRFGEVIRYEESYVMEGTVESADGETQFRGQFSGGDSYWRIEQADGTVVEQYVVDGDQYLVTDGRCIVGYGGDTGVDGMGADRVEEDATEQPDLTPVGRETIDGEEVRVYEISADDGEALTYYVSVDTGYPRRVESESGTFDFHSWGDVEPIESPDMDCREMGGATPPG